jgi:hypothetical protein
MIANVGFFATHRMLSNLKVPMPDGINLDIKSG